MCQVTGAEDNIDMRKRAAENERESEDETEV